MSFASHPLGDTKTLLVARVRERVAEPPGPRVVPPPRGRSARPALRGVVAGAGGATVATLWMLAVDALRGLPFDTPATLGAHVTHAFGSAGSRDAARLATLFIGMEYVAFALVGALAAAVTHRAHGAWGMLGALAVALVGLTVPLAALFALTSPAAVGDDVRVHVATAHVAAVVATCCLLWRARRRSRPAPVSVPEGASPAHATFVRPRS